ncbi:hypothetical protein LCGC14_0808480 [marine sediment metagenome]|uniref:Uncharacterized protein n=1 Tax=marine sediment metagenome TaxID=412755 RepID=A0A0F9S7J5_9ZZZZ
MSVKGHRRVVRMPPSFLTRVHDVALKRLMARLPLSVRKEWQGEAKQGETAHDCTKLELILTHKCGYSTAHKKVFLNGSVRDADAGTAGKALANAIYRDINKHKCSGRTSVPHLKIVKPWLCPICGVTDEKYPEWEGECNHARVDDSSKAKSKNRRARARIGGRKGPAKARREAVATARRGEPG